MDVSLIRHPVLQYAYVVDDIEAAGYPAVTTLTSAAGVAYTDTRPIPGCFVERYEDNASLQETFAHWKAVHDASDGRTDPIRDA
jgi:hypothetical protein